MLGALVGITVGLVLLGNAVGDLVGMGDDGGNVDIAVGRYVGLLVGKVVGGYVGL